MAPLSILPGRIRFEYPSIVGKQERCDLFEQAARGWSEVQEIRINHRTGRVLVQYDERATTREALTEKLGTLLDGKVEPCCCAPSAHHSPVDCPQGESAGRTSRHLLRDLVTHAILPSPLDLLLPTALAALRK